MAFFDSHPLANHLGFTGTADGMTSNQIAILEEILNAFPKTSPLYCHHGDCVGSDKKFDALARLVGASIHIHPPTISRLRAFVVCRKGIDHSNLPRGYLTRNRDIVNQSQRLLAASRTMTETMRSGTWYTVRYARLTKTPITIILPDGSVQCEG